MSNEHEVRSINDYTAEELRELAKRMEQQPYLDELKKLVEMASDIAKRYGKTAKQVLVKCAEALPKSR